MSTLLTPLSWCVFMLGAKGTKHVVNVDKKHFQSKLTTSPVLSNRKVSSLLPF